ncbi:hypothetical protein ACFYT4_08730 [Streptomyces sp. NPDC004609]|uniref:hypothetical protein n=1 Tax=Streptomyces sp. NPDC004609 TaxID=3364704 RepID=UPI0036C92C73
MRADGILWDANTSSSGRFWRRWLKNGVVTACWAGFALLVTSPAAGTGGSLFRVVLGLTAILFVIWAIVFVRDYRALIHVQIVGGEDKRQLRMTTVTGRVLTFAAEDVTRVDLVFTSWAPDPDSIDIGGGSVRMKLQLRRGNARRRRRGRWGGYDRDEGDHITAAWKRACPAATVTDSYRTRPMGTG